VPQFLPASVRRTLLPVADDHRFHPAPGGPSADGRIDCPACGELAGRGYPCALVCAELVDQFWTLDWRPLVECPASRSWNWLSWCCSRTSGKLPWTCTDVAMTLLALPVLRGRAGHRHLPCLRCRVADEAAAGPGNHMGYPDG